jgi:fatty-acyl-CoA synthase
VDQTAAGLLALGLQPGDRVGIWSPNCAEWVVTQLATARIGVLLVTLNPAYRTTEIEYALNKLQVQALVTATRFKSSEYVAMLLELAPELPHCDAGQLTAARLPHLKTVIRIDPTPMPGTLRFSDLPAMARESTHRQVNAIGATLSPFDPINVQFTSGTTGFPKGATLTHHNILNNGYFVASGMRFSETDRLCIPVPLYHCLGMVMANLGCLTHGACMVFPSEGFDPLAVLETLEAERCTALYGVPTMFIAQLEHPDFSRFNLSSLRTGVMAGSPCPIEVMKQVVSRMHMPEVTICYGMTETSPVSFQTALDDPLEKRVSTVGRIHPHVEAKVVDTDDQTVPPGTPGELLVRGYSVMQGYWDEPALTTEAINAKGWMRTGDLATLDADGYCNIVGRVKDMVIRGGENIYPREVEEFLYTHPAVLDVQCFGIPDDKYGEELCAWIRLRPGHSLTEAEVREYCTGRIAHFKIPRHVRFVDSYPMTVTGKVQKFKMRERMAQELGVHEVATA